MKVLIVNSVCGTGSTGRISTDLYDVLDSKNNECVIAYGRGEHNDKYKTFKIGTPFDNYIHMLNTRIFDRHGFSSTLATKKFIDFIIKFSPDVIHIHNVHGYYLNINIFFTFLKEKYKGRIIWTLHDCWSFSPHSAFIDYDEYGNLPRVESNKMMHKYPKSICLNQSKKNYELKKKLFSSIPNLLLVTPSKWLKQMVNQSFLSEYECIVINNGIDKRAFYKEKNMKNTVDKKLVLGVANIWEERKGLKFFNELSENLPSEEYKVVLVGKANKKSIHNKINHIEQTSNINEMRVLYNEAFCFINPTLEDNYPTTNLEALCCGTPIIVFDTGGNKEVIEKNNGIVTKQKNTQSILDAIELMSESYNRFKVEIEKNQYSKESMYSKYFELYKGDNNEKNIIA